MWAVTGRGREARVRPDCAHPSHSPMPDWECGNVSYDIILPARPVRTGKAMPKEQEKLVFGSDQHFIGDGKLKQ